MIIGIFIIVHLLLQLINLLLFNFRWVNVGGYPLVTPKLYMVWVFSLYFTSFRSIPDFFIYTFRIKQFREVLICKPYVSQGQYTHQSTSNTRK